MCVCVRVSVCVCVCVHVCVCVCVCVCTCVCVYKTTGKVRNLCNSLLGASALSSVQHCYN